MTQRLSEEEKAILWNAITLPGFQIECINSVVASIADGRARRARELLKYLFRNGVASTTDLEDEKIVLIAAELAALDDK